MSPRRGSPRRSSGPAAPIFGRTFASGPTAAKSFFCRGARRAGRLAADLLVDVRDAAAIRLGAFDKAQGAEQTSARLSVGSEVRFIEEDGEKRAQASTVRLVGKHHLP